MVYPTDAEEVRIGIADLEPCVSELVDEVDHTVLQVDSGKTENKRRNRVEEGAGAAREAALDPNAIMNGFQNLVVGSESGCILRLSALVKLGHLKRWYLSGVCHYHTCGKYFTRILCGPSKDVPPPNLSVWWRR
jgi:hypothetical protein